MMTMYQKNIQCLISFLLTFGCGAGNIRFHGKKFVSLISVPIADTYFDGFLGVIEPQSFSFYF